MKMNSIQDLMKWEKSDDRKPLVVRGARQVGKTWFMQEFGRTCYEDYVYFNFEEEEEPRSIFQRNKNPLRIIELLIYERPKD